jgi:ribonuclease-3
MVSDKMVSTVVEAVMGAVYLDAGEEVLEEVMKGLGFYEHAYL